MVETAALLTDEVLPERPLAFRQVPGPTGSELHASIDIEPGERTKRERPCTAGPDGTPGRTGAAAAAAPEEVSRGIRAAQPAGRGD